MLKRLCRKEIVYLVILAIAIFHLCFSVNYFRIFHIDDSWVASLYYEQFKTGTYISPTVHDNMALTFSSFFMRNTYGLIMNLFPNPYYIHRTVSLIISLYTLLVVYLIALEISKSRAVAVKSAAFTALIEYFVQAAHISRPDIMVTAFVLSSFLIFIKKETKPGFFFAGLAGGLAVDVHLIGILSIFLIAGWEITKITTRGRLNKKRIPLYIMLGLGYVLAAGFWLAVHYRYIGPMLDSMQMLEQEAVGISLTSRILWLITIGLKSKYYRDFFYLLLVAGTIVIAVLIKPKPGQKALIFTFVIGFLGFLIFGRLSRFYIVVFFPPLFIAFAWLTEKRRILQIGFLVVISYFFVFWAAVYARDGGARFKPYTENVRRAVESYLEEDTVIIGPINLWFVFKNNEYHAYRSRGDLDAIIKERPSILIISNEILSRWLLSGEDISPESEVTRFKSDILNGFIKVGEVRDRHFGSYGLSKDNVTVVYSKRND